MHALETIILFVSGAKLPDSPNDGLIHVQYMEGRQVGKSSNVGGLLLSKQEQQKQKKLSFWGARHHSIRFFLPCFTRE